MAESRDGEDRTSQPGGDSSSAPSRWTPAHIIGLVTALATLLAAFAGLLIAFKREPDTPSAPATSAQTTTTDTSPPPPPAAARPKNLRVLLAIDVSLSMHNLVREGQETRLQAAARAALEGLDRIETPYEIGLWTFHHLEPTEESPIAPYEETHASTIQGELVQRS